MKLKDVLEKMNAPEEVFEFYSEQGRLSEKPEVISDEDIEYLVSVFKCLANPIRLKLLLLLSKPHCVCVLSYLTGLDITLISHHLAKLKKCGLVKVSSRARMRIYEADVNKIKYFIEVFSELFKC